ncbi:MAG: penicillin-binding protein 2 [Candidatus Magasanikbacteria bacterium]|nr:penicillin-binding protein 2 [Candidatus Magasanikbacteria bacterium]
METRKFKGFKKKFRTAWVEDSFAFEKEQGRQIKTEGMNMHVGTHFTKTRQLFLFIIMILGLSVIFGRSVQLQLLNGKKYSAMADRNRERVIPIPSERGLIYDRNGVQLTENVPNFSLALIPQDLPRNKDEKEKIVETLANITNQESEFIRTTINEYGNYSYESITILEDLDYETALSIQIQASDLPGIHIQRGSKRLYTIKEANTSTPSLSHLMGYQGKLSPEELGDLYDVGYLPSDSIGKSGIEKQYESYLRGTYGRKRIEVNALGKEQKVIAEEAPTPGKHLTLTIDYAMQESIEDILHKHLDKIQKTRASVVVSNPNNGEILAMISLPSYDNNDFSGGIDTKTYQSYIQNPDNPLFNRAIGGTYPSGSVVKPAIATAALQEGIITAKTTFLSNGGLRIGNWFFPDWQAGGHGLTNVRRSIAWSVNTFYYYIGGGFEDFVGLGVDRITAYLKEYGLSEKLGIDIPGEQPGFLPSKEWKESVKGERWYVGDTYNLSIGQGDLLVTPLQINSLISTIANGGTLYKPHLMKYEEDPITKEKVIYETEVLNDNIVNSEYTEQARLGMKDCVDYGSCRRLSLLPFTSAGKTGTAQWSSTKENHAWFTAFAPYDNPEITLTVLVEEGGGGADVSAPIAFDILNWWWKNK